MTEGALGAQAKLRLVHGDSATQERELGATREQTTLTVGSGPSSSWVVRADGVRPLHFSLHWDGETLRIADTYGAGDVRADGSQVTAQWRSLSGRVRIDFGKAAMVVETSASVAPETARSSERSAPLPLVDTLVQEPALDPTQPLVISAEPIGAEPVSAEPVSGELVSSEQAIPEQAIPELVTPAQAIPELVTPAQEPPAPSRTETSPEPNSVQRLQKATLIGVSPIQAGVVMGGAAAVPPSAAELAPVSSAPAPQSLDSFRPLRPDSERVRKPTLLGMAISVPPPAPVPEEVRPQAAPSSSAPSLSAAPATGIPSGTLIGVSGQHDVRVQRLTTVSDRPPHQGSPQDLRGGAPGAATHAEVRSVGGPHASTQDRTERIGSTWQESSDASVPAAVMMGQATAQPRGSEQPPLGPSLDYEYGDAQTQMRDVTGFESRRPPASFPWRYVGIGALTAAAYFAWLYLLDHL